ncbi:uncharacterized protein TRIADDRAFT_60120 [Trichoplax adhaerens]|uniref:G-protein coupled receptors family 2 profile 2 domain-containing protein n=1 Tax=Trichoplax adhaerens TaxID=10228 RepID=B3S7C8_TRIAD|nr:hypothetical protein TRIADDRAFT_60120 [Trichoplax adhaerens]EDV21266.1 hypothetical protein TRIADDRAFT_60120 [Trichoplax adhaerens]|eukprot:XP_002116233.1 hypothetical protein TRIADDRAFT_60120 [Trichoplax adhaerens]
MVYILCITLRIAIAQEECADGWTEISNRCFKSFTNVESFEDARIACQAFPCGDLAADNTSTIHDNLKGILQHNILYWIGLKDIVGNNQIDDYRWLSNGKSVTSGPDYWANSYPKHENKRCVHARSLPSNKFQWRNSDCSDTYRYICQRPISIVCSSSSATLSTTSVVSDTSSGEISPSVVISTSSKDGIISTATTTTINEMGNSMIANTTSDSQLLTSSSNLDFVFSSTQSEGLLESSTIIMHNDLNLDLSSSLITSSTLAIDNTANIISTKSTVIGSEKYSNIYDQSISSSPWTLGNSPILVMSTLSQMELMTSTPNKSHISASIIENPSTIIVTDPISIANASVSDTEKAANHHLQSSSNLIMYSISSVISVTTTTNDEKLMFTFSSLNDELSFRSTSSSFNLTLSRQENVSVSSLISPIYPDFSLTISRQGNPSTLSLSDRTSSDFSLVSSTQKSPLTSLLSSSTISSFSPTLNRQENPSTSSLSNQNSSGFSLTKSKHENPVTSSLSGPTSSGVSPTLSRQENPTTPSLSSYISSGFSLALSRQENPSTSSLKGHTSSCFSFTSSRQENPSILPVSVYRKTSDAYGYFSSHVSVDLLNHSGSLSSPAMLPSGYSSEFPAVTASTVFNPSPSLDNGNSVASGFMTNNTLKEIQVANDQFIANITKGVDKRLGSVLKQIDHYDAVLAKQINQANITTRLTLSTPNSGKVGKGNKNCNYEPAFIALAQVGDELIAYTISVSDTTPIINLVLSLSNESEAEVRIPRSIFLFSSQADTVTVVVRSYRAEESWTKNNTDETSSSIISNILSCSMYPLQDKNFTLPVHFYLKIRYRKLHPPYRCVYWENTQWSQYGTDLIGYNSSTVHCTTIHFTSFAVLMQGSKALTGPHDTYLRYITYIGYSISLFALLMMIIILISSRKLHAVKNFIHLNLAIAMVICISGFLAGMNAASLPLICTIIAITLHFFYLASLMWMMMEAILLLHKISSVRKNMDPNLRWVYFIFGWAPPAIVVSVSASTGIDAYRNRDYCWIRNATTQMWFFVGPIIFIVAWNVVVVVTAIRSLFSIKAVVRKSEIQKFKVGIKAVTSLVFLFGISWIFGILYYATNHIVLAYLFTILNCPQGLLIFYFHCFQDREMQDYMRKKFKLGSMIFPTRSTGDCSRDIRLENTRSSRTAKISVRPISQDNACYECRDIGRCSFSHNKTAAIRKDSSNRCSRRIVSNYI